MTTSSVPVVLVHGWGGSFASTWQRNGFTALLDDAGLEVIGVDLLGHGDAPKPHDPDAYHDLTERVVEALPEGPVDAVGFSLGAMTLLRLAIAQPQRFNRLVLAGVGANILEPDPRGSQLIAEALGRATAGEDLAELDNVARLFVQYAQQPGNDLDALAAVMNRPASAVPTSDELASVTCPVLVVVGDRDFAHPGDALAASFPDGRCQTLKNVDHLATPDSFGFFDAALEFLDAI
jgi:pimeloyl-ACP methyl ester carboxylesterase